MWDQTQNIATSGHALPFYNQKVRWTFDWFFSVAKPAILSKHAMAGNCPSE
jgi:hypothetical protein